MGAVFQNYLFLEFIEKAVNHAVRNGWSANDYLSNNEYAYFPEPFYYSPQDDYWYTDSWIENLNYLMDYCWDMLEDSSFVMALFEGMTEQVKLKEDPLRGATYLGIPSWQYYLYDLKSYEEQTLYLESKSTFN